MLFYCFNAHILSTYSDFKLCAVLKQKGKAFFHTSFTGQLELRGLFLIIYESSEERLVGSTPA